MITARPESPSDRDEVRRVVTDAFQASEFGHHGEADIVDRLRDGCPEAVSLVAIKNKRVVGHILFSPVTIFAPHGEVSGMGLAPMAVATDLQRTGIGTALISSGLERLGNAECPFVVVLGHPEYYARFGFVCASQYEISHGFAGLPQDVFFIRILDRRALQSIQNGTVIYRPEFGPQQRGT